jgi:signal transduction histidine kinase
MITASIFGVAAFLSLWLGMTAFFRERGNRLNRSFMVLALSMSGWLVCGLIIQEQQSHDLNPIITSRVSMAFASFIAASFVALAITFSGKTSALRAAAMRAVYLLAAVSTVFSLSGWYITHITVTDHVAVRQFGPLSLFFTIYVIGCVIYSTAGFILTYYGSITPLHRLRAKYILLGMSSSLLISIVFSLLLPLLGYNRLFFVGHLSIVVLMLSFYYAVVARKVLDTPVILTRIGLFAAVYGALFAVPLWWGFTRNEWKLAFGLSLVLAMVSPLLFHYLYRKVDQALFSRRRGNYQQLMDAVSDISDDIVEDLLAAVARNIREQIGVGHLAVYLFDKQAGRFLPVKACDGQAGDTALEMDDPLVRRAGGANLAFFIDETGGAATDTRQRPFRPNVAVPLRSRQELLGLIVLGDRADGRIYADEDMAVFSKVAQQVTPIVRNRLLMDDLGKAQERLFNAERIAMVQGMAEGAAHHVGHRLQEFSMISYQLKKKAGELRQMIAASGTGSADIVSRIDEMTQFSESIKENIKRTDRIIEEINSYAETQEETAPSEFPLAAAVEKALEITRLRLGISELPVHVSLPADATVYGRKGQITDCLISLLCNAHDGLRDKMEHLLTPEQQKSFTPDITLTLAQRGSGSLITVQDNGAGISDANRLKVFSAFFTTKASSRQEKGISLYVTRRIIEEIHGGRVWFESEYGKMTRFFMELPGAPRPSPR